MDSDQINRLKFIFEFMNTDLHPLAPPERLALAEKMDSTIGGFQRPFTLLSLLHFQEKTAEIPRVVMEFGRTLETYQELLQGMWESILGSISRQMGQRDDFQRDWEQLKLFQMDPLLEDGAWVNYQVGLAYEKDPSEAADVYLRYPWPIAPLEKYTFDVKEVCDREEDRVRLSFVEALKGVHVTNIKQCENRECQKWFVHLSKKKRLFCSDKCRSKLRSRQRYERVKDDPKLYEKELEMAKERRDRLYQEKRRQKAWPDQRFKKGKED